jgi:hypothetical protein
MAIGSLDGLALVEVNEDLYRNIVSLRVSQDLFDDLSDDPADWQAAIELEAVCKPPQYESRQPVIDRPFEDAEFISAVRFPFDNWSQSRFSRGQFGVWYGSPKLEATIFETVYHWRNGLLADTGLEDYESISIERRVHLVHCRGALINLFPKAAAWPELRADDYAPCQSLGERIHREGHPGLWTLSARCDGVNAAVFTPRILSDPRTHCYLTYRIESGVVTVWRDPNEVLMTV